MTDSIYSFFPRALKNSKLSKEKGFHGARMADIARKAGISYGLIYHYLSYIYLPWSPRDLCLCNGIGISAS
ncbi:MAG TPA: TetR/AcrR family transcriptional regulator [Desulfobacteraceae bacterium]|nr:TetR/AcrR family transcriptional regulator [Desulfobacteraceae bacterium]